MKTRKPTHTEGRTLALLTLFWIALGVLCHVGLALADDPPLYTDDEVAAAIHCVSEASGARSDDCRVIVWIDAHQAARRGQSVADFIATTYRRHRSNPRRPWLGQLNGRLEAPADWPEDRVPWETVGRPRWRDTLEVARAVLQGGAQHGCDGVPLTWGGPRVDHDRLMRWQARGYDRLVCGVTRNVFIGRRR